MTKVWQHPGDWEKHDGEDYMDFIKRTGVAFNLIAAKADKVPAGKYVGAMVSFSIGDGAAYYILQKEKPLTLLWIPYCDRYQADPILLRGLRLSDVKKMIDSERALAKFFKQKATG